MIGELWRSLIGYLEQQPYWHRIQPIVLLLLLYAGTAVTAYQYVGWQYGLAPTPADFLRSYVFKQITVACVTFAFVVGLLRLTGRAGRAYQEWGGWLAASWATISWRIVLVALIVAAAGYVWIQLTPHRVASVRIKLEPPEGSLRRLSFDPIAFTYLIYELNRRQRAWHFEVDLRPFSPDLLSSGEVERCRQDGAFQLLCQAVTYQTAIEQAMPLVLITEQHFASSSSRHYYWLHQNAVSVISASDWERYAEPNIYDYLVYSTIIQGILIHLDISCAAPEIAYQERPTTTGDLFEFQTDPDLMPARLLSAHVGRLGPRLFNCFGPAYAADAGQLLSLEWLHDDRVRGNLQKVLARARKD